MLLPMLGHAELPEIGGGPGQLKPAARAGDRSARGE
jgi:hypothetical protein